MNVLATTWPPSCRAASPWSTPTPRTSPSLMKETGWSDDDQGESKHGGKRQRWQQRTNKVQVSPIVKLCSPHLSVKKSFLLWWKKKKWKHHCCPLFLSETFFYLVISLSCRRLCSEGNLYVVLVCLSRLFKRSCSVRSFLHCHTTLFPLNFS